MLSQAGYDGVTFEAVARRSGAAKASLYRRWASRREMVLAALKAGPARREGPDAIDTGSLRGDLLALCRRLDRTMRSADSKTAMLLLQAGLEDAELCEAIETSVGPTGARLPRSVLEAAIARGELPTGAHPFPFEEIVGAVLLVRRVNALAVDEDYLAALVDTVLVPSLQASAAQHTRPPEGIFSGAPRPELAPEPTKERP